MSSLDMDFACDVPLGPLTWYGVGGKAQCLAHPRDKDQLALLVQRCAQQQVPTYILGSGANLLVRDGGVPGVVVQLDGEAFVSCAIQAPHVVVGAGYDLMKLVRVTAGAGLSGLESLAGIPASAGGAVRMNAGGVFGEIGPLVHQVQAMAESGDLLTLGREDLAFGYRCSNLAGLLILEVTFALEPGDPLALMKKVKEVFAYKKTRQPLGANSGGCAFKNPAAPHDPAGQLIDRAGLKGFTLGSAQVSPIHANFITVDKAGGRADDVVEVMAHVQSVVNERFGVMLDREVVVWP